MTGASSIKVRSTAQGITIRATGAAAAMLVGAVRQNLGVASAGRRVTTVHFADEGQDVLEWDLDADQVVIDSRPFQAWCWRNSRVIGPVKPGVPLVFVHPKTLTPHVCQYQVSAVVEGWQA